MLGVAGLPLVQTPLLSHPTTPPFKKRVLPLGRTQAVGKVIRKVSSRLKVMPKVLPLHPGLPLTSQSPVRLTVRL